MTPLFSAAKCGDLEKVRELISAGADINVKDEYGRPLLLYAAMNDFAHILDDIIAAGADVNMKDSDGWTPLHHLARYGLLDSMKVLIAAGADVNAKDLEGRTILHTSDFKNVEIVKTLISAGAIVDDQDERGQTALHFAARENRIHVVQTLIKAGADVNSKDVRRWTPLHVSAGESRPSIVNTLIMAGADVNAKTFAKQTPLHFSALKGNIEVMKVLIAASATIDPKDNDGRTPLEYAGVEYSEEACKILIKYSILYIDKPTNPQFFLGTITIRDIKKLIVFWNKCKKQVKKLKETFLGNSCVSFFKFLKEKDDDKLALYAFEENFALNTKSNRELYTKNFPIYTDDVEKQFVIGFLKARILIECQELMKIYFCKQLPTEVLRKICKYLTNKDLTRFLSSQKFNKGEENVIMEILSSNM